MEKEKMVCLNCHKDFDTDFKYCPYCGIEIPKKKKHNYKKYCNKCNKKFNEKYDFCPYCGTKYFTLENASSAIVTIKRTANNLNKMFVCANCGEKVSNADTSCAFCGFEFEDDCKENYNVPCKRQQKTKGNNYGLSIAAFVCSIFVISTIIGLIFGIIVCSTNEKPCTAKSFGIAAITISSIYIFILFCIIVSNIGY